MMTIEISEEERSFLLLALGFLAGASIERKDEELIQYFLKQANALREKLVR